MGDFSKTRIELAASCCIPLSEDRSKAQRGAVISLVIQRWTPGSHVGSPGPRAVANRDAVLSFHFDDYFSIAVQIEHWLANNGPWAKSWFCGTCKLRFDFRFIYIFLMDAQSFQHCMPNGPSFLHCIAFVLLSKIALLSLCGFSGLSLVCRGSSRFLCRHHTVLMAVALQDASKFGSASPLTLIFSFNLLFLGLLPHHKNVKISLAISTEDFTFFKQLRKIKRLFPDM